MSQRARTSLLLLALIGLAGATPALTRGARVRAEPGAPAPARVAHPPAKAARPEPEARADEAPAPPTAVSPPAAPVPSPPPSSMGAGRADRDLARDRAAFTGGLFTFPTSFASEDGAYDLVLHLNGNTELVEESYGHAAVNAVVLILNLGVGSGKYEDRFADPTAFDIVLARVQAIMEQRGLRNARLRRVALAAWSSGYGGVYTLLGHEAVFDRVDAIVLLDAIHCGWDSSSPPRLKSTQIEPIRRFAKKAAEGRALLSITHSEIVTYGYLNAHETTDKVLELVGVPRQATSVAQPMPALATMVGVLPKAQMVPLAPLTEAHRGGLHVRGYDGNMPVTHMLHLVQMSTTALPDLAEHWRR